MNRLLTQHVTLQCDFSITENGHICTARDLNITSGTVTFIRVATEYNYGVRNERVMNLVISRQNFHFIPDGLSKFFKNLEIFTIFKSNLNALRFTDFIGLSELRKIFIVGNAIEAIDEMTFHPVPHLQVLDLTDNQITSIPFKAFADAKELKILTLSSNLIRIFDIFPFPAANELEQLRLSRNRLVRMNLASIMNVRELKVLELDENYCINMSYPFDTRNLRDFYTEIVTFCNDDGE